MKAQNIEKYTEYLTFCKRNSRWVKFIQVSEVLKNIFERFADLRHEILL